ncbi:iron donor protein CyaY [Noviherbaspirillum sp. 1P10PC]|jgi:CyaY protein|uniref:iron donor protein CyaY n=1 Tax=Noviherbaspirillum sp. 1P10PC TaxID=3132292 RepID=UPI00389C6F47
MTDSEFLALAEATLDNIEGAFEQVAEETDVDIECSRSGNVLQIEFADNGSKIIVNSQAPMKEMWIAARSGGFHYRRVDDRWINTRDGSEFYEALSRMASEQAGIPVTLKDAG